MLEHRAAVVVGAEGQGRTRRSRDRVADELRDRRHVGAVDVTQVLERLVFVHAFERAHCIARHRDSIPGEQRAVRAVPDADVRVLACEDDLVDAEGA